MKKQVFIYFAFGMFASCMEQRSTVASGDALFFIYSRLDESPVNTLLDTPKGINTGWTIYEDIMWPNTVIEGRITTNTTRFNARKVLNCEITGGDAYNNIFYTNTLARNQNNEKWYFENVNTFIYSVDFFVDSHIDSITPNLSEVEGLEFAFQHAMPPYSNLWALQWSKSDVWCYWDDNKINGKPKGWVKLPKIKEHIKNHQWNNIVIAGHYDNKKLYYEYMTFNDKKFELNKSINKGLLPEVWRENYIQVGFQINGNKAIRTDHKHGVDPVSVYLDNVSLQIFEPIK